MTISALVSACFLAVSLIAQTQSGEQNKLDPQGTGSVSPQSTSQAQQQTAPERRTAGAPEGRGPDGKSHPYAIQDQGRDAKENVEGGRSFPSPTEDKPAGNVLKDPTTATIDEHRAGWWKFLIFALLLGAALFLVLRRKPRPA